MKKEELMAIAIRAKEVGIAIYGYERGDRDFDNVEIDEYGEIYVNFSYYSHGDIERDRIFLTEEDMESPIEETVARHKKKEQDKAEREAKEKLEIEAKEKLAKEIAKEKAEKTIYERLKLKYEGNS